MSKNLLLEIGTEEMPANIMSGVVDQLKTLAASQFEEHRISTENITVYATPRRLAVIATGAADRQPDEEVKKRGPSIKAAFDADGNPTADGDTGEIVIHTAGREHFCGLFLGYYQDKERTEAVWHDGLYHTGDLAWRDEDGFYWYVGRADDVIKSSGYRIGPFEIENVIMELPYVLECGVSAAPDEVRGQVVKASIVLVPGKEGTEELKKEIQNYVKEHTAPYKYPRIVVFRDELPKTISGKIIRNQL